MKPGFYTVELVSKLFLRTLKSRWCCMMPTRCTRPGRCQRGISTSALLVPEHLDRFFVDISRFKFMKNIIFNINIIIIIEPARYVQQQTQSVEARMGET